MQKKALNEDRIRIRMDDAALGSGWFSECPAITQVNAAQYLVWAEEHAAFLKKVKEFRQTASDFFGDPPENDWDYDGYPERKILPVLEKLELTLARSHHGHVASANSASTPPASQNASKPELDLWRARLLQTWRDETGLPIKNTKHLRRFIVEGLSPYQTAPDEKTVDRGARDFILKAILGRVLEPASF